MHGRGHGTGGPIAKRIASPTKKGKELSLEELLGELDTLKKYRSEEEKQKKKDETHHKRELQVSKKKLTREIQSVKSTVRKRHGEVQRLRKALERIEKQEEESKQKRLVTTTRLSELLHKAEQKHHTTEAELQERIGKEGEARGTLAYLEYAQQMLERGVHLDMDPAAKLMAAEHGRMQALTEGDTYGSEMDEHEDKALLSELDEYRHRFDEMNEERKAMEAVKTQQNAAHDEISRLKDELEHIRSEKDALHSQLDAANEALKKQEDAIEELSSRAGSTTRGGTSRMSGLEASVNASTDVSTTMSKQQSSLLMPTVPTASVSANGTQNLVKNSLTGTSNVSTAAPNSSQNVAGGWDSRTATTTASFSASQTTASVPSYSSAPSTSSKVPAVIGQLDGTTGSLRSQTWGASTTFVSKAPADSSMPTRANSPTPMTSQMKGPVSTPGSIQPAVGTATKAGMSYPAAGQNFVGPSPCAGYPMAVPMNDNKGGLTVPASVPASPGQVPASYAYPFAVSDGLRSVPMPKMVASTNSHTPVNEQTPRNSTNARMFSADMRGRATSIPQADARGRTVSPIRMLNRVVAEPVVQPSLRMQSSSLQAPVGKPANLMGTMKASWNPAGASVMDRTSKPMVMLMPPPMALPGNLGPGNQAALLPPPPLPQAPGPCIPTGTGPVPTTYGKFASPCRERSPAELRFTSEQRGASLDPGAGRRSYVYAGKPQQQQQQQQQQPQMAWCCEPVAQASSTPASVMPPRQAPGEIQFLDPFKDKPIYRPSTPPALAPRESRGTNTEQQQVPPNDWVNAVSKVTAKALREYRMNHQNSFQNLDRENSTTVLAGRRED